MSVKQFQVESWMNMLLEGHTKDSANPTNPFLSLPEPGSMKIYPFGGSYRRSPIQKYGPPALIYSKLIMIKSWPQLMT